MTNNKQHGAIINATVANPATGELIKGMDIAMSGGKISSISPADGQKLGFDGSGLFAIPGMIDTHVHILSIFTEGSPGLEDMSWIADQHLKNFAAFARAGVTTVRDMGAPLKMIRRASSKAEQIDLSPRIVYAGPVFSVRGGYPYFVTNPPFPMNLATGPVRMYIGSRASARNAVDSIADKGVNCIKVTFQRKKYDDEGSRLRYFPRTWLREIIDRAHHHNLPVAIHNAFRDDLPFFIDLDLDSLEHIVCDEILSDKDVSKIAKKNIPVCATLMCYGVAEYVGHYEELLKNGDERFEKKPLETVREAVKGLKAGESVSKYFGKKIIRDSAPIIRKNLSLLYEAGVKIVHGTDSCGCITPAGCPHWEFEGMKKAGMSDLDILKAATTNAANAIRRDDLGKIAAGATADIVLLKGNPFEDIMNTTKVAAVFKEGKLIWGS